MKSERTLDRSLGHFITRGITRYGRSFSADDYAEVCRRCRDRDDVRQVYLERQPAGLQRTFVLVHDGTRIVAVWSDDRDLVTTLLPPEQFPEEPT
jgi:hypothetical protein